MKAKSNVYANATEWVRARENESGKEREKGEM